MRKQKNSFRITTSLQHRTKKGLLYGITWKGRKRKIKLRWKKLQKDEYIFFEKGGRRTYLVHSKERFKEIKKNYRRYGDTPFGLKG